MAHLAYILSNLWYNNDFYWEPNLKYTRHDVLLPGVDSGGLDLQHPFVSRELFPFIELFSSVFVLINQSVVFDLGVF